MSLLERGPRAQWLVSLSFQEANSSFQLSGLKDEGILSLQGYLGLQLSHQSLKRSGREEGSGAFQAEYQPLEQAHLRNP